MALGDPQPVPGQVWKFMTDDWMVVVEEVFPTRVAINHYQSQANVREVMIRDNFYLNLKYLFG